MPTPDYPSLPEPKHRISCFDMYDDPPDILCYTADQMHAYLATERARIEREVMPIIDRALPASLPEMAQLVDWRRTILRAIRGEKEPT